MKTERLQQARDRLPPRLNAGILQGDGGFCVLGWMLVCAGYHPIKIYSFAIGVADPVHGGSAIDVVAREYDLPADTVRELAQLNDATASDDRVSAVRHRMDAILEGRA